MAMGIMARKMESIIVLKREAVAFVLSCISLFAGGMAQISSVLDIPAHRLIAMNALLVVIRMWNIGLKGSALRDKINFCL